MSAPFALNEEEASVFLLDGRVFCGAVTLDGVAVTLDGAERRIINNEVVLGGPTRRTWHLQLVREVRWPRSQRPEQVAA
jgi:hypothetical protein